MKTPSRQTRANKQTVPLPSAPPPIEVEVGMSRAEWLADVEVAVTSKTPDPLAGHHHGEHKANE